jgi:hypothetical protein
MTTIKDWDDCIADWYNNNMVIKGPMASFGSMEELLSFEYLPEPYYGDYRNCIIPVININPGSGSNNEDVKNWNYAHNPKGIWSHCSSPHISCGGPRAGQLINDFAYVYKCKYSDWQKDYSPFVAPPCVPGVNWWKNNRNEYINRVLELYDAFKKGTEVSALSEKDEDAKNTFVGLTPYALELCPLHSKSAPNFKKSLINTFIDNTIAPACVSLKYSKIPFGLGFSAKVCNVLLNSGHFVECKRWENGYEIAGTSKREIISWPQKGGKPINRTYVLLKGKSGEKVEFNGEEIEFNNQCPYFLITWQSGSFIKLTHQVMLDFEEVDEFIVNEIAKIV